MNGLFISKKEKHHIIIKNKFIFSKGKIIFYHITLLLIYSIIISSNSSIDYDDLDESKYSYITLKIGQGTKKVYSDSYQNKPSIVYINENKQSELTNSYSLERSENDVILIWEKPITDCGAMFQSCNEIIEMDLTLFDTSQVNNMVFMFDGCTNLRNIDISNIDTSKVENIGVMFGGCSSLTSLNLSNFNTSSTTNIGTMFKDCSSLKSINLSNFDISKNDNLDNLFNGCSSLTSIDLSNFVTSNVRQFQNMFWGCTSLISLNFPNLDLSSAVNTNDMFVNCKNLEYVNIKNFKPNNYNYNYNFFRDCPKNIAICMNNEDLIETIRNDNCNTIDCSNNWQESRSKITENNDCVENCTLTEYKYEYKFKCYSGCLDRTYNNNYICEDCHENCKACNGPFTFDNNNCISCLSSSKYLYFGNCIDECPRNNSYYFNESINQNICNYELKQCKTCSLESLNKNMCVSCDTEEGYYPTYDDLYINNLSFYNCYKSLEGYYLDEETLTFKLCYTSCKSCNKSGDEIENNCLECKFNYKFEIRFDNYKNCYDNCSYYHYFNENENVSYCTNSGICPEDYNKLIEDKKECISRCEKDNKYKYEFKSKCYSQCPSNSMKRENNDDFPYFSLNKNYFCKPICNEDNPYEIIYAQECVRNCDFKEIKNKSCILQYKNNDKEDNETAKIYDNLLKNVEDVFLQMIMIQTI